MFNGNPHLKPDKRQRAAIRAAAAWHPAHEPYAECDCPWFGDDYEPRQHVEQPAVETWYVGDTEWNACQDLIMAGTAFSSGGYLMAAHSTYLPVTKLIDTRDMMAACLRNEQTPAPFAPNTAPLVAAVQRKEADLLLKVKPEDDCLHVDAPAPVVAAVCAQPVEPTAEHIIQPVIMVDGKPETEESVARRFASCSLRQTGKTWVKCYDGLGRAL